MLRNWSIVRTFNADTKRIIGMWSCVAFAYFGISGVLFNLYLLRLGFGIEYIGWLTAAGQMLWGVLALPVGALSRRTGLRPLLITGLGLVGGGMALLLLVEWLPQTWWSPWIVVWWLTTWIGGTLFTVNGTPYLMLAAQPEERNHAFAAVEVMVALLGFVGAAVAGLLPSLFAAAFGWSLDGPAPYWLALWLVPPTYALAVWIMAGATPLQLTQESTQATGSRAPLAIFAFFVLLVFLQAAGTGAARAFFNVFLDTGLAVSPARIGAIMGVGQLLPVLASLLTPSLLERWGTAGTLFLVGVVTAFALIVLGLAGSWLIAGLGFAVVIALNSVGGAGRNIYSQELVSVEWRSISAALATVGVALSWAAAAALGGYLIGTIGFRGFFFVCALLSLLSAVVLLTRVRVPRLRPQPAADD